jgi:hypothetical protein
MSEIFGSVTTTPINPNKFSGSGGSSGGNITVDQTYKPESENPQSGTAVAEAVGHKANLEITPVIPLPHTPDTDTLSKVNRNTVYTVVSIVESDAVTYITIEDGLHEPIQLPLSTSLQNLSVDDKVILNWDEQHYQITSFDIVKDVSDKQDKLTAGDGITIDDNNVISAPGGGSGGTIPEELSNTTFKYKSGTDKLVLSDDLKGTDTGWKTSENITNWDISTNTENGNASLVFEPKTVGKHELRYTIDDIAIGKMYLVELEIDIDTKLDFNGSLKNKTIQVGGLFSISLGGTPVFDTYDGALKKYAFGFKVPYKETKDGNGQIIKELISTDLVIESLVQSQTYNGQTKQYTFDKIKINSIKEITGGSEALVTEQLADGTAVNEIRMGGWDETLKEYNSIFIGKDAGKYNAGYQNTVLGYGAMANNISGMKNTVFGYMAMHNNIGGFKNLAFGQYALLENTFGSRNIAIGQYSLQQNTTGCGNIGIGADAFMKNTTGSNNIGIGKSVMGHNIDGSYNIAIGDNSLTYNESGIHNIGIGNQALLKDTTGYNNIGIGPLACRGIETGFHNIGIGANTIYLASGAANNIAMGNAALQHIASASGNIAIGVQAMQSNSAVTDSNCTYNVVIGYQAGVNATKINNNVLIGKEAGKNIVSGNGNILIGANTQALSSVSTYYLNIGNIITGSMYGDKYIKINGGLDLSDIPTSDPNISGRVWNDNGTLKVSMGAVA